MEEANFIMKNSGDEWPALGQIHRSYLLRFRSCEHLNMKTRIEETKKMIEKLDQDEDQIIEELKKKLLDRDELNSLLKTLRRREEDFGRSIVWKRRELHPLQVALDKVCCANKAYQVGTIYSGGELNTFSLHHKMLHKNKSVAEEKQLLREIKASQKGAVDPCLSMEKLNSRTMGLYCSMVWERSSAERKQMLREIRELEVERDNMISTANLKGKIWDSLGSKEAIQNKIKDISIDLDGTKKKHLSVKAEITRVKKEMRAIDKCMIPLQKKLVAVYQERDVTYKHLLELRKQEDEGGSKFHTEEDMVAQVSFMNTSLDELPASEQIPQSYEDRDVKARIEEAEKMIQKWNQDGQQITEKLRSKVLDWNSATSQLEALKYPDKSLNIRQVLKRKDLEPLQLALDRFFFANKASRGRTNIGSCSSAEGLNPFSFHYKMLHKAKNLGEEKQVLREISASQRRAVDSCISVEKLNYRIKMLHNKMEWERNSSEKKQLLRNIKELEVERDKAISNANSHLLGSKEDIQNHIKIISNDLDGIKKEHLPVKAKIKHVKKETKVIEKDVGSLQKKLVAVNRKKDEAYKSVLEWKKLLSEGV